MFCFVNVQQITKYCLLCAFSLAVLCTAATIKTENYDLTVQTKKPLNSWDIHPTVASEDISRHFPYLYFTTITFALIIVGSTFLVVFRSCFRTCAGRDSLWHEIPATEIPVISRFRRSLVPTDAILINGANDKPPDYATTVLCGNDNLTNNSRTKGMLSLTTSDAPPPSYGSIV